jgi:hypothetical protein
VSRYAGYEALGVIGSADEAWTEANTRLDEQIGVAAAQEAAPPVDALEADFVAGVEVTRAVIAFAATCPTGGPHLDDLPNAAFVQAMYQAVTAQLQDELDALTRAWAQWLPVVGRWTPASTEVPPPRPTSPAHSHVLATVDAWWEAEQESMRERLVGVLTKAGGELTGTSVDVGPDGQMIENTHIRFRSELAAERGGVMRRFRGWVGGRRP